MKKTLKRFAAILLAATCLFGTSCAPAQAASSISSKSTASVTLTIKTKGKLTDILNAYPAKITFSQKKGTYTYTDTNGKTKTYADRYCQYDVSYVCYDEKNKAILSGTDTLTGSSTTVKLRAKYNKICTYKVTIKPHYAYVYNKNTRSNYLAYKWTKPSAWTITPGKDICGLNITSVKINK